MSRESQPNLPTELEEVIFSLCLHNDWNNARSLFLVAKRVYQWLGPQLYAVAIFHPDKFEGRRPKYTTQSLIQHGQYVRHLLLSNSDSIDQTGLCDPVEDCISWCPNLRNVALWTIESRFEILKNEFHRLAGLPYLAHLSIDLDALCMVIKDDTSKKSIPIFPNVTHLELLQGEQLLKPQMIENSFPAITHLSLDGLTSPSRTDLIEVALRHWGDRLQVVIWFLGTSGTNCLPEVISTSAYISHHDPRVVILTYGDHYAKTWYEGTQGGMGMWRTADEAVRKRRQAASS
ncbi:hypothetical protein BDN72DRAFT_849978 [Pluteus cervinus]|uniref:Uncharacterized protein n=1 Tax=Pluteus cervinus TaxID=181527 RepID=A0ACD3A5F8_9AGAR|nr:hypothetical protein BDN72DRAFT_849978 [Pluteus cervinus]